MGSRCSGSSFLAFQLLAISEPKLNSAIKISLNSSTSSSIMVKFSNTDVLSCVKTKSLIVFTASLRPDSAWKGANNTLLWVTLCGQSIAKNPVTKQWRRNSYKCSLNGGIKGKPLNKRNRHKCAYLKRTDEVSNVKSTQGRLFDFTCSCKEWSRYEDLESGRDLHRGSVQETLGC